jgi:hypothetical protein
MNLDTIFRHLPDGVLCRELKLLYVSGRLFEVLEGRDINKMPLTKIEKMFLKWAMKQWKKSEQSKQYAQDREAMKLWATKVAITGEDREKPYIPTLTHPTFSIPDSSYIPASIRANVGTVGVAVQNTGRAQSSSEVFQAYEEYNREKKEAEDFK